MKKNLFIYNLNLISFNLNLLSLVMSLQSLVKSLSIPFYQPPLYIERLLWGLPEALSSPDWTNSPVSLYLGEVLQPSGTNRSVSFLCWGFQSRMQHSRWALSRVDGVVGRITSLSLLVTSLLMQPTMQLAVWAARAHCQLIASLHPPVSSSPSLQG